MTKLYTIGHSTRTLETFLALLREHGIAVVVDVRRFPASWRHPEYNGAMLAASLRAAGITYIHEVELGGRRNPHEHSPNRAWRNAAFRGYADHMQTDAFRNALERVLGVAREKAAVVLCAESVPWRCHRNLIADAAVTRSTKVLHILGPRSVQEHKLHPAARVEDDGRITYPDEHAGQIGMF